MIEEAIKKVSNRINLSVQEAEVVLTRIAEGLVPAGEISSFLVVKLSGLKKFSNLI